jgi:hypothetical protein
MAQILEKLAVEGIGKEVRASSFYLKMIVVTGYVDLFLL